MGLGLASQRYFLQKTNECPNSVSDDSDGYESDRAVLQLITTDAEIDQNAEGTGLIGEQNYLNL